MNFILRRFRNLRKHWKLTLIAVFSLSIAMGLGVVSLSVSNTYLLLPPAGQAPERLVMIHATTPVSAAESFSYPDYEYYRSKNTVFSDLAAAPSMVSVTSSNDGGSQIALTSRPVSDNYFEVLGIRPFLGRFFTPGEDKTKDPIAVMTYSCWQRLGADPNIVGRKVGGIIIVGVAPKEFTGSLFGLNGDLMTAIGGQDQSWLNKRSDRRLYFLARLKPGVTRRQAQTEMAALSGQLALAYPEDDKDRTSVVTRATLIPPDAVADVEWGVVLLMALILLVLLIACANVANLLLAIAVGRRQEAAIKLALGAPRSRLIRDFLAETSIICAAGSVLGYALAAVAIRRFGNVTFNFPYVGSYAISLNLRLDPTVVLLTVVLMMIATLATGLAPALYASSPNLSNALAGEIVVGGTRRGLRRSLLVGIQVAMCTLVLVAMGLCERSLYNLRTSNLGFAARNLIAMQSPGALGEGEPSLERSAQYREKMRAVLNEIAGVESVTFATGVPILGFSQTSEELPERNETISIARNVVDPPYFSTFGIPLLRGRTFDSSDRAGGTDVVVVNQTLAERFWPGQDAVGKLLMSRDSGKRSLVIGVIADSRYNNASEKAQPAAFYDLSQYNEPVVNIVVKTKGDPHLWVEPVRKAVRAAGLDSAMNPITFDEWMEFSLTADRIAAGCMLVFGALGLLLAILGLLGAVSYSVSERKKELGIRVALGAQRRQLLQMILRQTLWITASGVFIGLGMGIATAILLQSEFYGVRSVEWLVLIPVGVAMIGVSLLAAYGAARPWLSVDPLEAVRHS